MAMDAGAAAAVAGLAQAIFTFNASAPPLFPAALGGFEPDTQTKHQCVCQRPNPAMWLLMKINE